MGTLVAEKRTHWVTDEKVSLTTTWKLLFQRDCVIADLTTSIDILTEVWRKNKYPSVSSLSSWTPGFGAEWRIVHRIAWIVRATNICNAELQDPRFFMFEQHRGGPLYHVKVNRRSKYIDILIKFHEGHYHPASTQLRHIYPMQNHHYRCWKKQNDINSILKLRILKYSSSSLSGYRNFYIVGNLSIWYETDFIRVWLKSLHVLRQAKLSF